LATEIDRSDDENNTEIMRFHCNRLTTLQDIQDYASVIFWHTL